MNGSYVAYSEIELSPEEVLKEIGYGESLPCDETMEVILRLLDLLKHRVRPQYVYFVSTGRMEGNAITCIRNQALNTGPIISRLLDKSSSFAVFAATAGAEFEQIVQEYKQTEDILVNYILDIMGTAIVEKVGDRIESQLEDAFPEMLHTHRFSPGYCNWLLTEQRKIFELLGDRPCGITLSDVCLMNPIKSISGIIGIGKEVQTSKYACRYCELKNCYKRKS
ncbi:MAG: hypothetical protein LBH60_00525 [Prevotellaceae bacterium]|jgi:hypothetical protein|nr:hypothetical protein [Prevotellaceae bacterium]